MAQHINEILVRVYEHGVVDEHAEPHYYNEKPNDLDPLMLGEAKQQILIDLLEMAEDSWTREQLYQSTKPGVTVNSIKAVPVEAIRKYFGGSE